MRKEPKRKKKLFLNQKWSTLYKVKYLNLKKLIIFFIVCYVDHTLNFMRKISVNWVVTKTFSDFKIATTFMLIGSILYLGAMEPREASRAANSHQAKAIQVSCDIIYSIFTTLAILGFTYLSWFEGW